MSFLKNIRQKNIEFEQSTADKVDLKSLDENSTDPSIESDKDYRQITNKIVDRSVTQLENQNKSKQALKDELSEFFKVLITIQMLALMIILFINGFSQSKFVSDTVIIALISSMFTETLAALIAMVKYAFDSSQEVEILKILGTVVERYQKFEKNK